MTPKNPHIGSDFDEFLAEEGILPEVEIALNLQAEEILAIMALVKVKISKHELSAFFRAPGHNHYRECNDQMLRNFLKGLQLQYRGNLVEAETDS